MKSARLILFPLLIAHFVNAMRSPSASPVIEVKSSQIVPYVEQLKMALSTIATPEEIRQIIEAIQNIRREFSRYPLERRRASQIIAREKAFLMGHAKSVVDIYNEQVRFLTKHDKPISDDLKKKHANAYINLELIQDFLATLEQ